MREETMYLVLWFLYLMEKLGKISEDLRTAGRVSYPGLEKHDIGMLKTQSKRPKQVIRDSET
jgi:hypothetical protein